jgi:uncharacterized membrane protein YhhN
MHYEGGIDVWYGIISFYYCLLAATIFFRYRESKAAILISKTLSSLAFMGVAFYALHQNPGAETYAVWIITGLGLSLVGDVFLVYGERPQPFILGLLFFLLAHIAYGTEFTIVSGSDIWDAIFYVVLVGVMIFIRQRWKIDMGKMTAPVLAYLLVISFMVSQAFSICMSVGPSPLAVTAGLGALLFFISDAILAWNKFKSPFKIAVGANLTTYYTGQLLLALSILFYTY